MHHRLTLRHCHSGHTIDFLETDDKQGCSAEHSCILEYANNGDWASSARQRSDFLYKVDTISLTDLLDEHNAPKNIGYLSIDTEGSELEMLKGFNFNKYNFRAITIDHNYSKHCFLIKSLLESNGYKRILTHHSACDNWYISISPAR